MRLDSREWICTNLNTQLQWIHTIQDIDCYSFLQHEPVSSKLFTELEKSFLHSTGLSLMHIASNSVECSNLLFEHFKSEFQLLDHCCRM